MQISTSILNASDRIDSVINLNRTNTSYIHIDVMDGKFVNNEQFTINEIKAINLISKYPLDVHLMVDNPIKYINELDGMNIEWITFHLEIEKDIEKIIKKIKKMGYKVGISIKPDTSIYKLVPYLNDIDMVLVMSVEPGLGGQKFISGTIKKIRELRKLFKNRNLNVKIEVDGGINEKNIFKLVGVDIAVVGSYIVKSDNYYVQIETLLDNFYNHVDEKGHKKRRKKPGFYKLLLWLGLIPYLLFFAYGFLSGIGNAINGVNLICFGFNCPSIYGLEAFINTFILLVSIMWPILFIGLILIIFSGFNLIMLMWKKKKKTSS